MGRFLGVDPLAASTDMISPYAAMGNAPESLTDPTGLQPELPSKISTAGFNSIIFPYKTISEDYARMMEANSNIRLAGLNRLPDFLRDAIYGSNRGNGGGSFLLEYSIYIEIPNLVGIMTGNCSMLGVTSNFVCNFSAGGGGSYDGGGIVGPFEDNDISNSEPPEAKAWDLNGDNQLSPKEVTNWRENGNGRSILVPASSINIGYIDTKDLNHGDPVKINLSTFNRHMNKQGRVYGELKLIYNAQVGGFSIISNKNDYDVGSEKSHPWFGKNHQFWRNVGTVLGGWIDGGKNGGVDFWIHFDGYVYPLCRVQ